MSNSPEPAAVPTQGLHRGPVSGNLWRAALAEAVGTAILVFAGTAVAVSAILERTTAGQPADSLAVGLAFGLTLVALVGALGHVSGAHLNPAVTLAFAASRKLPTSYVPAYVGAQLVGAVLGALATWLSFGDAARDTASLAATFPAPGVSDLRAVAVEALVTFVLVLVIVSVATDDRAKSAVPASLCIGVALAVGVLVAGPVTGGAVNPARALGPMLVAGEFDAFWVYIVGPVAGGVAAALLYARVLSRAYAPGPPGPPDL